VNIGRRNATESGLGEQPKQNRGLMWSQLLRTTRKSTVEMKRGRELEESKSRRARKIERNVELSRFGAGSGGSCRWREKCKLRGQVAPASGSAHSPILAESSFTTLHVPTFLPLHFTR
jgi:hypothetical protein